MVAEIMSMSSFDQLREELDDLKAQGEKIDTELEDAIQKYNTQADEADQLLRERQADERAERSEKAR